MIGKDTLMNPYTTSPNALAECQATHRRTHVASISADEKEHLARLGHLVAPVLKEVRNPVSALLATSELLDERMALDDSNRGFVRLIRHRPATTR